MDLTKLKEWAETKGYRVSAVGADVFDLVRAKLEARRREGLIDREIDREYLADFSDLDRSNIAGPKAIVMVALPSPSTVVSFETGKQRLECVIPPTYLRYRRLFKDVREELTAEVLGEGTRIDTLDAPLKSLAVHMGLSAYGRNNITYIPEFGSGFQICGYVVGLERDFPGIEGKALEESVMDRCASCRACVAACPTGAIEEDRFQIRAERCYTFHSEHARPIPDGIRHPAKMSLIGCMACQDVCPLNKGRLKREPAGIHFDVEETKALLNGGRRGGWEGVSGGAARSARAKLASLGLSEDVEVYGRNLALLIRGHDVPTGSALADQLDLALARRRHGDGHPGGGDIDGHL